MSIWHKILIIVAMLGVGFFTGRVTNAPYTIEVAVDRPFTIVDTLVVIDTVYVAQAPVYIHTPAHTDTVYLPTPGNDFRLISAIDTVLRSKSTNYGQLKVQYIHPPWDEFDINFTPAPLPTIVKVQPVVTYVPTKIKPRWYKSSTLLITAGAAAGAFLTYKVVK